VLIRKPDGSGADFRGKLSYAWPKTAAQGAAADRDADPQFAYGYGLTYADRREVGPLSEVSGVAQNAAATVDVFFRAGRAAAPWTIALADAGGRADAPGSEAKSPSGTIAMTAVDAGAQESGRSFAWSGTGEGSLSITGPQADFLRQANGDMAVAVRLRLEAAPTGPVAMDLGCGGKSCASLDVSKLLASQPVGEWRTLKVKLSCFREAAADMTRITTPFALRTSGRMKLSIADVALASNTGDAVCP
jgi:beta-glucosidase